MLYQNGDRVLPVFGGLPLRLPCAGRAFAQLDALGMAEGAGRRLAVGAGGAEVIRYF
ncbi:hypothetical protein [Acetobacter persici]|uniref:hypothetical protein n=1 Tax=Acetobacter persici TaxID=1076596 RepID=UPI0038D0ECB6